MKATRHDPLFKHLERTLFNDTAFLRILNEFPNHNFQISVKLILQLCESLSLCFTNNLKTIEHWESQNLDFLI